METRQDDNWCPGDMTRYHLLLTPYRVTNDGEQQYVLTWVGFGACVIGEWGCVAESYLQEKMKTRAAIGGILRWLEGFGFEVMYGASEGREWGHGN